MRTFCRLGSKRRLVATIECDRLWPNDGPLAHEKQTLAMGAAVYVAFRRKPATRPRERQSSAQGAPQPRHRQGRLGGVAALIPAVAAGASERLVHRLDG